MEFIYILLTKPILPAMQTTDIITNDLPCTQVSLLVHTVMVCLELWD